MKFQPARPAFTQRLKTSCPKRRLVFGSLPVLRPDRKPNKTQADVLQAKVKQPHSEAKVSGATIPSARIDLHVFLFCCSRFNWGFGAQQLPWNVCPSNMFKGVPGHQEQRGNPPAPQPVSENEPFCDEHLLEPSILARSFSRKVRRSVPDYFFCSQF